MSPKSRKRLDLVPKNSVSTTKKSEDMFSWDPVFKVFVGYVEYKCPYLIMVESSHKTRYYINCICSTTNETMKFRFEKKDILSTHKSGFNFYFIHAKAKVGVTEEVLDVYIYLYLQEGFNKLYKTKMPNPESQFRIYDYNPLVDVENSIKTLEHMLRFNGKNFSWSSIRDQL